MKRLSLLSLLGFVFIVGCQTEETLVQDNKILFTKRATSDKQLLFHMTNSEIKWAGGKAGLDPQIVGKAAEKLFARGTAVTPTLIRGLEDEEKFAACHVLLTKLHLEDYYPIEAGVWNSLKVGLNAKGEIVFDKGQIPELIVFWKKAIRAKKLERLRKENEK